MKRKKPKIINGVVHWQCSKCEEWLEESNFYARKVRFNGLMCHCKKCHKAYCVASLEKHAGEYKEREQRYYQKNKVRIRALQKERASTPEARKRQREWEREYRKKNAERRKITGKARYERMPIHIRRARGAINTAVYRGKIIRPTVCERCGEESDMIHGHHTDYSKPLDVQWLCALCHKAVHAALASSP